MTTAFPLQWPSGRPRTAPAKRRRGKFSTSTDSGRGWRDSKPLTVADARGRLQRELARIGARLPVISSNVELRLDGAPRSGRPEPEDPGVAVYFQLAGRPHCMPCDTYGRVADNIAAVAAHIKATRAIERHGVATVSEMFAGFMALPPPSAVRPWHAVLGVAPTAGRDEIEAAYRRLARERHPDAGGSDAMMSELNVARAAALAAAPTPEHPR